MKRINAQLPEQQELAIQSLSWITFAKRPLTVLELQHALAIEKGTSDLDSDNVPLIEDVVFVCAGLLTTDGGLVRLVHYTTQEYFERTHPLWLSSFSEAEISDLCLTYLSFDYCRAVSCGSKEAFETFLQVYPFYDYAAFNWERHVQDSQSFGAEITQFLEDDEKLEFFFRRRELFYSVGKGLHVAAQFGLDGAISLLLGRGHYVDVRAMMDFTPLHHASFKNHSSTAKLLLS